MRKVASIAGFILLAIVGTALFMAFLVLFGWLWAILVLVGKIKIGPRSMWDDQVARRDFAVRRTELKLAGGLLACYFAVMQLIVVTNSIEPDPFMGKGTLADWVVGFLLVVSFLVLIGFGFPLLLWKEEWERTSKRLRLRYQTPVLF